VSSSGGNAPTSPGATDFQRKYRPQLAKKFVINLTIHGVNLSCISRCASILAFLKSSADWSYLLAISQDIGKSRGTAAICFRQFSCRNGHALL
jgi:hypothetical protein